MVATEAPQSAGEMVARARAQEPPLRYTGDDLIMLVGGVVSRHQFKRYAAAGLLPTPEKRVPPGATDGVPRALYPWWTIYVLNDVIRQRASGARMADLQATATERIERWASHPLVKPGAMLDLAVQVPPDVPRALQRAAWEYAARYATAFDQLLAKGVTIALHDGDGGVRHIPIWRPGDVQVDDEGRPLPEDRQASAH